MLLVSRQTKTHTHSQTHICSTKPVRTLVTQCLSWPLNLILHSRTFTSAEKGCAKSILSFGIVKQMHLAYNHLGQRKAQDAVLVPLQIHIHIFL